jgi:RimJ/RimL family protein N-acetyltransferase
MEENDEDDAFIHSLRLESQSRATNEFSMFKPVSKAASARAAAHHRDEFYLAVLICLSEDGGVGKPIGRINLHPEPDRDSKHHRKAELGIQLREEHQGKGYGTEAIEWILEWAFKYGGLHRVGITSSSYNPKARRLYERLGFVNEGVQREALWFDDGWHDIILVSILEDEWRQRQQKKK